ncbi:MAG: lantibiotic dehydratase, partial [Saprospiraceae bacterium]|nr:lantibiotic dehydratase [Saprospiraceae bacterium]
LQAHFSLVHVDGTDKVLFIGSPYASGLNMINRFTHIDAGTERISQALTQREAEAQKDVLVAELMHTPAYPRKLNVLQHRSTRACEIPFLGLVSKNCNKTIFLDDLYLKVVKNRFVLYSANHDAEVQVMLSTAIRYSLESHPIYHFLGDLQYQNKLIPLKFDWGPLRKIYRFLPRVCYKDVIISQATWVFSAAEILDSNGKLNVEAARFFQKTNGIPDQVELITGDNTLFIDFSHDFCARLFCQHCQKYGEITIREFLPPAKQWAILDEHGMNYRTELVAFFMRRTVERTIKPVKLLTTAPQPPVSLDVFSDWIYFKIYCGTQGGEDLLIEYLLPLAEALLQEKVIKKWFFIRYNDEGYHIRVRFHLQQKEDKILLLNRMGTQMEIPIQKRIIHKIKIETYYPEIGRYGEDNMERTEHLFFIDSMAVLSALANLRLNGDENLRWQFMIWFGNQLLDDFGLLTKEKIALMEKLLAANGKNDNQRVNAMYKTLNPGISDILSPDAGEKIFGKLLNDLAARKSEDMRKIISGLSFTSVDRYAYIGSFLHMMINRFSLGRPNHHEIVLYNYLLKYYKTKAREN